MDNRELQEKLVRLRLLDPPIDGVVGIQTITALKEFQYLYGIKPSGELCPRTVHALENTESVVDLKLGGDLASRIIKYCIQEDYYFCISPNAYTIVYLEGADWDGTKNRDLPDEWNDRRIVIEFKNGQPAIIGNWLASCEPGDYYTYNPLNPNGAARIELGQYRAWRVGIHGIGTREPHEALVQSSPVTVARDGNKDKIRTGDMRQTGNFGINQHHGYDLPKVGRASAGCLVGQSRSGHQEFMKLIKSDRRYLLSNSYTFFTAVIDPAKLP